MEHDRILLHPGVQDYDPVVKSHCAARGSGRLGIKELRHCPEGLAAVRDGILGLFVQFGHRLVRILVGNENRVVAETALACPGPGYAALENTLEEMLLSPENQCDHCLESGPAGGVF